MLEGLAARLALKSLSPQELDEIEAVLDAADEARGRGDFDAASACGAQFHRAIHRHTHNRRLLPILENLEDQLQRLRELSNRGSGRLEKSSHQHRQVLEALREGDADRAEHAMRSHLESVLDDLGLPGVEHRSQAVGKDNTP